MERVKVTIVQDGPYEVVGPITLQDEGGNHYKLIEGEAVYLCRCGGSETKPFCDGTHSKIGFYGAMKAVNESESTTLASRPKDQI